MDRSENQRVDERGRVTLPQPIRESLDIEAGDEVTVELEDGQIVIQPRVSRAAFVAEMRGCVNASTRAGAADPTDSRELKTDWTDDW